MTARIAVMEALDPHVERVVNPERNETHWGKRSSSGTNNLPSITGLDALQHNEMRHYATPDSYEFVYVRIL